MSDLGPRDWDGTTEDWSDPEDLARFESRWKSGDRCPVERFLAEVEPSRRRGLVASLIELEIRLRREAGEWPSPGEYLERFPEHAALVDAIFGDRGETSLPPGHDGAIGDGRSPRDSLLAGRLPTEELPGGDGLSSTAVELDHTRPSGAGSSEDGNNGQARPSRDGCRYRIESFYKGGGLGEIYIADDLELNRKVALKEIRERLASDYQARARFRLEAEVIGNLEHPGIVPVYGKGQYRDGRLFYAMKLIKGDSLREAIDLYHKHRAGRTPSENELMFRGLLGRFVDACNAIEYAHSRNVLHRDIKPANIMLGRFGETVVLDWGLAKLLDRDDLVDEIESEAPLRLLSNLELDPTRMDKALGTLRYMSPEQAAGKLDLVGKRSDVFSLGATLFCLLAGRAPYIGTDPDDLKDRAIRGDFPHPRKLVREIPAPLESICLKAMEIDPADRYESARALSDDVERWLADEPARAHHYRAPARIARWARRHRPLVAALSALLITLSIALVVSNFALRAEEKKTEANYKLALDERKVAEKNARVALAEKKIAQERFQIALEAVDQMLARVNEESLAYLPQLNGLRTDLSDDAARFYKRLVASRPDDRNLKLMHAHKCMVAANNHWLAGRLGKFLEYYDEIFAIRAELMASDPGNRDLINYLAHDEISKGVVLQAAGRVDPAIALLRKALIDGESLVGKAPKSAGFAYTVARARLCLANALGEVGKYKEAAGLYDSAIDLLEPHVREQPKNHWFRRHLIMLLYNRAIISAETGDSAGAKRGFDYGLAQLDELKAQGDAQAEVDYLRSILLNEQGRSLMLLERKPAEAELAHTQADELMRRLRKDFPEVPDYQTEGALALLQRGLARAAQGEAKLNDAEADLKLAVELIGPVAAKYPDLYSARSVLGRSKGAYGGFLIERGERERGIQHLKEAVETLRRCLKDNKDCPRDKKTLGEHEDLLKRMMPPP